MTKEELGAGGRGRVRDHVPILQMANRGIQNNDIPQFTG